MRTSLTRSLELEWISNEVVVANFLKRIFASYFHRRKDRGISIKSLGRVAAITGGGLQEEL